MGHFASLTGLQPYSVEAFLLFKGPGSFSLRKPKVFALQILQRYLTKEGRVRKFFII